MSSNNKSIRNKLSVREMGFDQDEILVVAEQGGGKDVPLVRMYGMLRSHSLSRPGANGERAICFEGLFEGVNIQTGEVYRAIKMYLPSSIAPMLQTEFDSAKEEHGGDGFEMKVAFDITVQHAPATSIKYKFGVISLTKETVDPFEAMKSELPALPSAPGQQISML